MRTVLRTCAVLVTVIAAIFALTLSTAAQAAMIMVDSLADPSASGRCTLHDAITAANTKTATNGCTGGEGTDTILFCITGTITLASTLPQITDANLTITGPPSPGITIDGGGKVQIMQVAPETTVKLSDLTIAHGSIISNITGGGGIDNQGLLTVSNSTFSNNSATSVSVSGTGSGGGILNDGGLLTITNSTFSGNSAELDGGGGILVVGGITGSASVKSTILAANAGSNCTGTITDAGYNISDDATCGFAKTGSANNGDGVNPMLSPTGLANNGGPTQTIALLPGSPAIDAIPLAHCTDQASPPNPIITDQRLFPRPDGGEVFCDIGAYEVQDTALIPFSRLSGGLSLDPDAGVFNLSGGFKLGVGGSINPATQPVAFSIGGYAVRLPAGSFVKNSSGYVSAKTINHIFERIVIKFTNTPGSYRLLVYRNSGTIPAISLMQVTLTIGHNSRSTQMNAKLY
jgi:hypothetical protein